MRCKTTLSSVKIISDIRGDTLFQLYGKGPIPKVLLKTFEIYFLYLQAQKEQYLNYRRVYHGDTDNIFALQKKAADREQRIASLPIGPQAFDNISNAAAIAMATALQTAQKPTGEDPVLH